jgi:predicted O-methyltransferase YrrM
MNRLFALKSYIRYRRKARHREGFGIHSPFVFRLLNAVFFETFPYYCYEPIEAIRAELLQSDDIIELNDLGSGGYGSRKLSEIVAHTTKKPRYARLLFRLANSNRSQNILELGSGPGLTTLYLAMADSRSHLISIEGDKNLAVLAERNLSRFCLKNKEIICANIDDALPGVIDGFPCLDFVFFDANHTYDATVKYFRLCLPKTNKNTIFVFDDIHASEEMETAWNDIKGHPAIRLSIDIYEMGICFFNDNLIKQEYIVAFK